MYLEHPAQQQSPSILVVDDDADIRSLTRTFLEQEGYRVYTSGDADRASRIFHSAPHIDLLITDYFMPQRSGMDLAFELKSHRPDLPILVISGGFLDTHHHEQLRNRGWNFLAKPFALPQLLAQVHEILQPRQLLEATITPAH